MLDTSKGELAVANFCKAILGAIILPFLLVVFIIVFLWRVTRLKRFYYFLVNTGQDVIVWLQIQYRKEAKRSK
jgi:hypothetical protein